MKILIYDAGLFCSLAELLATHKDVEQVGYFCDWQEGFPDGKELVIGTGLNGVTRVKYFWDEYKKYDLIVFPDVWYGDLQEHLRGMGCRVWGGGRASSLELSRWNTRELIANDGLPLTKSVQIEGLENLRSYLKDSPNVYVKISQFRGMGETFQSVNYEESRGRLDELRSKFGAIMDMVPFVVEQEIPDAKENGYDGYCIDGEFPNSSFYGVEVKNKAYFGKLVDYDKLPSDVREANTRLSYHMDGYRQFWSTELRDGCIIDLTARHASPAGETMCHAMKNIPEVLYEGAAGNLVHGQWSAQYAAQIMLCSDWAKDKLQPFEFPEEIRPFVKIYNHCIINGVDYCVFDRTSSREVGNVIGLGNTPEEAVKLAKGRAEQVSGFCLHAESDALDEAVLQVKGTKS